MPTFTCKVRVRRGHKAAPPLFEGCGAWAALARTGRRAARRANAFGVIMVARQTICLGRLHAGHVVAVHVSDSTLTIDLDEGPRTMHRTTDLPIRNVKAHRPRKVDHVS
ncbi:hypothetical protein ABZU75_17610 [Streptosporangium sp. NPDC005286]|uniref:hypothetical protein n=1 Tax=Streptosporangium sp. NPDC005286 TaxID=3154463 RepID=UPI00339DE928